MTVRALLYECVVIGVPRTKGNSPRLWGRGGYSPSAAFMKWQSMAVPQLQLARKFKTPIAEPVRVESVFYRDAARGDLDNYFKAMGDLLQAAGVLTNDKHIVSWDGSYLAVDTNRPRVHVKIFTASTSFVQGKLDDLFIADAPKDSTEDYSRGWNDAIAAAIKVMQGILK